MNSLLYEQGVKRGRPAKDINILFDGDRKGVATQARGDSPLSFLLVHPYTNMKNGICYPSSCQSDVLSSRSHPLIAANREQFSGYGIDQ